jgi:hypothetical protein
LRGWQVTPAVPASSPEGAAGGLARACMMTAAWSVLPARPRVWQLGAVCLPGVPAGSC